MSERERAVGRRLARTALAVSVALSTRAVLAQDRAGWPATELTGLEEAAPQPDWGTQDASIHALGAWDFNKVVDSQTWSSTPGLYRYRTSVTSNSLLAGINLPAGARVTGLAAEACDTSTTGAVSSALLRCTVNLATCTVYGVTTGSAPAPGCAVYAANLTPDDIVIDNAAYTYLVYAFTGTTDDTNSFRGVRVSYKLQVSPAPAIATFPNDVPTSHPFFRYVEALAHSGITGGCGTGAYCPDSPVTRGQMAVFLAVALGLHWPN